MDTKGRKEREEKKRREKPNRLNVPTINDANANLRGECQSAGVALSLRRANQNYPI